MIGQAQAAIEYAAGGALVLPLHTPDDGMPGGCSCRRKDCSNIGKHPRTLNGLHDATSDVETVQRWWEMWPNANIGLRPHLGQIVCDIDPRSGGAVQAVNMQRQYGRLPATRTAATGGGGWHVWLRYDGETVGKLAAGLDIKNHGGFLVSPPSMHASGQRYQWTNTGLIAAAPGWLAELLTPRTLSPTVSVGQITEGRLQGLLRTVATAAEGTRNGVLYWASRRVLEAGGDPNPLIDAALTAGLARREAERTIASAAAAGSRGGSA